LVVHGNKDVVVTPINAFILAQHLPDAQLVIYPDASHGAQSQHPGVLLEHARMFLNGEPPGALAHCRKGVLRNVSFRRSAGIRIRRNTDGASERAQRQLATRLSLSKPSGRRSAMGAGRAVPGAKAEWPRMVDFSPQ
jgi:hypothetical protein